MTLLFPGPAYRIQTRRLIIRCWNPSDAPHEKEAIDASIEHLLPWMPFAADEPQELQQKIDLLRAWRSNFDAGTDFLFGIFNPDETRVLGGTGLHPRIGPGGLEIGYWIRKDAIGQGFATEVSAALTRVAFEVQACHRVEIHCDPRNVRSAAVPRKLGFTHEATLRERAPDHLGRWKDSMVWSLLARDYPFSPAAQAEMAAFDAVGRSLLA
jgi:RimJ/RimL family protein N-acetyltransferase